MKAAPARSPWSLALLAALLLAALGGQRAVAASMQVRYRSAETIYLTAGSKDGLEPGRRLQVVREGVVVAELEISFVAEHSSSCRLVSESQQVIAGDLVREASPGPSQEGVARRAEGIPIAELEHADPPPIGELTTAPAPVQTEDAAAVDEFAPDAAGTVSSGATLNAPLQGAPETGSGASHLHSVDVSSEGDSTVVRIVGDGQFAYSAFALQDPDRWVVDLSGVINSAGEERLSVEDPRIERVRRAQFKRRPAPVARVVIDLRRPLVPTIETTSDGLALTFGGRIALATRVPARSADSSAGEERVASQPRTASAETAGEPSDEIEVLDFERPVEMALEVEPVAPIRWEPRRRGASARGTRISGTLGVDWESSTESQGLTEADYQRLNGRLDLRIRDIGGLPYELRARMRTQQNRRGVGDLAEIDSRDRFYELSLTFDPPQGRYAYRVGRMSASPFVGIGYFDGALGQFALSSIFEVGAFAGSSAQLEETGFSTSRQKYGLFGRFTASTTDSGFPWEVVVAGVREHGEEDISREYVTLQSRYSTGGRWSLFQRAEVDLNRGWRKELSGTSSQLSNFSLSATARLSRYSRLSIAYDRFEQYRTEETRELPEDLFRDLQRQGLRANLQFGSPRRLNVALTASLRDQEGAEAKTISYGAWVRHGQVTPWKLSLALNYLGFSNEFTQGYIVTLRSSKRLSSGHQLDLTLGSRLSGNEIFVDEADERTNWARVRLWLELPSSLYATAEYELTRGDILEGQRLSTGLGYRF